MAIGNLIAVRANEIQVVLNELLAQWFGWIDIIPIAWAWAMPAFVSSPLMNFPAVSAGYHAASAASRRPTLAAASVPHARPCVTARCQVGDKA